MNQIYLFIELIRLKKPIGFMLLFWPCSWGLIIAYDFSGEKISFLLYLSLFFLGAVLMRSAGCIINDIADRNFDNKVQRTKDRPIASGKISVFQGFLYSGILCFIALIVLLQFNYFTILLALGSMPLAFIYPLMKRYTYWPQLFLGVTFNYGLILGWTAVKGDLEIVPILFYIGAIFWTLGYDTIYGFQDIQDDEIIGLKSTSIKFKGNAKKFLFACYSFLIILFTLGGHYMNLNSSYFILGIIPLIHLFFYQIKNFNYTDPSSCLSVFKSNNIFGLLVLFNILIAKLL